MVGQVVSTLIEVISIVSVFITLLKSTHEPTSRVQDLGFWGFGFRFEGLGRTLSGFNIYAFGVWGLSMVSSLHGLALR